MNTAFNLVALFPMKKNSVRVVNKNFKDFCGKPLFYWILEKLLKESRINKVIINTDGAAILENFEIIKHPKIILRNRKKEICGDDISMNKIIADDINSVKSDLYFMTHTTNPLLRAETISEAIDKFYKLEDKDSLFSVNKIQTRFYDQFTNPVNHDPNNLIKTQDLPPLYEENSNFYIFSENSFLTTNSRIGRKPFMFITEPFESVDIDNPADWERAEVYYNFYHNKGIL